nr:asparaginase domain-containing protein [Candidatus Omnitrophota bacterium]
MKSPFLKKSISFILIPVLFLSFVFPYSYAQEISPFVLPSKIEGVFYPPMIRGLSFYPQDPFKIDFFIDRGDEELSQEKLKEESQRLIKYFLASLAVPEKDMWVNLSPYEKNRIVPEVFGKTIMGRDLLLQDYFLKNLTASLLLPENEIGKKFWDKVYGLMTKKIDVKDIPVDLFYKIWIIPDEATIFINQNNVFIVKSHLKVMLEEDYLSLKRQNEKDKKDETILEKNKLTSLMREIIVPEIEREVNEGKIFTNLRQIYHAMVLATWYKENLKNSVLKEFYADRNKIKGVEADKKISADKIYNQYLKIFQDGVYSRIKEEYDPLKKTIVAKKYFTGGVRFAGSSDNVREEKSADFAMVSLEERPVLRAKIKLGGSNIPEVKDLLNGMFEDIKAFGITFHSTGGNIRETLKYFFEKPFLLRTGGTLEMKGSSGREVADAISEVIDAHHGEIGASMKAFEDLPDSSNIGIEEWIEIIRKLKKIVEFKKEIKVVFSGMGESLDDEGGIVITTGTDTVEHIASALSYELLPFIHAPIVLTAAALPLSEEGSDVFSNFALALKVAQDRKLPKHIYFAYADQVHLASRIRKFIAGTKRKTVSAQGHDKDFESYGPIVGKYDSVKDEIKYETWIKDYRPDLKLWDSLSGTFHEDDTEHVVISSRTPVVVLKDVLNRMREAKKEDPHRRPGLIIQGKKRKDKISEIEREEFKRILLEFYHEEIPVLVGSAEMALVLKGSKVILMPHFLSFPKARIKLAWLLAKGAPFERIDHFIRKDFIGEIGEDFPLGHNYENFPENNPEQGKGVIVAYPNISWKVFRDMVNRLISSKAKNKELFVYGFGDGNLPLGHKVLKDLLRDWFKAHYPTMASDLENFVSQKKKENSEETFLKLWESAINEIMLSEKYREFFEKELANYKIRNKQDVLSLIFYGHIDPHKRKSATSTEIKEGLRKILPKEKMDKLEGIEDLEKIKDVFDSEMKDFSPDELLKMVAISPYSMAMARRLIKTILMESHPILFQLGKAVEAGIRVNMESTASESLTNTGDYE